MAKLKRKYKITFAKFKTKIVVTYNNNHFSSYEYISGGLSQTLHNSMGRAIPLNESDIAAKVKEHQGKVIIEKIESKNPRTQRMDFLDRYLLFHHDLGVEAKINGVEGKALNQIIAYLNKQAITEKESYEVWDYLLSSWANLEPFHQKQTLLRQIDSNLTILLTQIKDGRKNTSNSQGVTPESMAKAFFDRYGKP